MDIDHAIRLVETAPDSPAIRRTVIDLVRLVSALDHDIAILRQRVQVLEADRARHLNAAANACDAHVLEWTAPRLTLAPDEETR